MNRERWADLVRVALFGTIDGLNGMVGLVVGLARVHAKAPVIFTAVLAVAAANAVSMAGAQYESDDSGTARQPQAGQAHDGRRTRMLRVAAMGAGYLASALLPGIGFALGSVAGWAVLVPSVIVILAGITWFRSGQSGWGKAMATTTVIFALSVAVALLASLTG